MADQKQEEQNDAEATRLVEGLLQADTLQVRTIIENLANYRSYARDDLRKSLAESPDDSNAKLHAALAMLSEDASVLPFLKQRLLTVTVAQFGTVRDLLAEHKSNLIADYWQIVDDGSQTAATRFHAACALAEYSPDDERWQQAAPFVSQHLTTAVPSVYIGQWMALFQPARQQLATSLAAIHANRSHSDKQRETAAFVLSDYLRDQPDKLADVILVADESAEFSPLFAALKPHAAIVQQRFLEEMQAPMPAELDKTNYHLSAQDQQLRDAHWERQSLAAVTLVHLGFGDDVWSLLEFTPNPSLRSYIIHHLGTFGTDHNTLAARLQMESDVTIRRALIQSLGGLDETLIPLTDRNRIAEQLQALYVNDPDSGIHSSSTWTLRQWGMTLPELPVGPSLNEEQKQKLNTLIEEVEDIRQRTVTAKAGLPARQIAWERQMREQPASLPDSLSKGLVAHFPLDESEGADAANSVDGEPGGVFAGPGQPEWIPGVVGNASRLDRKGGHFHCGEAFAPERTDAFSYGCWFLADTDSERGVLFSRFSNADEQGFALNVDPVGGNIICEWSHHYPENTLIVRAKVTEITGQWHHLFVVYDGSSNAAGVTVHIDGHPVPLRAEADSLSESIQVSSPFQIGKRDSTFAFKGHIDDVRIFNRQLSEDDVQHLYASGLRELAGVPAETRTPEQQALLSAEYRRQDEPLQRLENQLAAAETARWNGVRRWYVNGQGQTMVVIPNDAESGKSSIDHSFVISSHEVTVTEFRRFRDQHSVDSSVAPTEDCPVHRVTWYEAAEYCNWLSEQEGIPEEQWVYEPNDQDQYTEGMKVKDNTAELSGYRLPTEAEWELACRAGSSGAYGFGESVPLLEWYAQYIGSSSSRSHPVVSLLPNTLGLFGMHGNLWEWTQNPNIGSLSPVRNNVGRVLRGGSFIKRSSLVRSATRNNNKPTFRNDLNGFRPSRTYHFTP